ncbi:MAG: inositol monophosphatase family protein [Desulfuromonadales bacterium]|nr:inositol monophosphatase family protein [Desulfuromonadales bacterium]
MTSENVQSEFHPEQLPEIVASCREVLIDAGQIALRHFRQDLEVDNKLAGDGFDPVTRADREVESFLRSRLTEAFPSYGVIGEEEGITRGLSDLNWVIDPIDGTKAFISGLPTWGMLLGLMQGRQVLAGLMYQPFTGELFVGSAAGAWLYHNEQGHALATRSDASLQDAILYCTHESMFANPANLAAFRRVAERVRLQRFGGDCYAYCMLALGRIDLVIEDTLQPYDIIPLIPIIEAAGGVVTDAQGGSAVDGGFVVAAANKELHRQALEIICET